jgi:hypothetical protein
MKAIDISPGASPLSPNVFELLVLMIAKNKSGRYAQSFPRQEPYLYLWWGSKHFPDPASFKKSKVSTRDSHCAGVLKKAKATSGRHKDASLPTVDLLLPERGQPLTKSRDVETLGRNGCYTHQWLKIYWQICNT